MVSKKAACRAKLARKNRTESDIKSMSSRYGLNPFELSHNDKNGPQATLALFRAINKFKRQYKKISEKYPNIGIGDTGSDEALTSILYEEIHG